MTDQEKQESQKTVVAFIAGLLIGGLLVWVFGSSPEVMPVEETVTDDTETVEVSDSSDATSDVTDIAIPESTIAELPVGNGAVSVADQEAGLSVELGGATFPSDEGWIGVRDYVDGQLAGLLGVSRYSKEQGLVPEAIVLQRSTVSGNTYAVVFYSESGDRVFNLADDVQVGGVMGTFVAR